MQRVQHVGQQAALATHRLPNETIQTTIQRWIIVGVNYTRGTPVIAEPLKTIKKKKLVKIFTPMRFPLMHRVVLKKCYI